jgi:hypothetical protein
VLLTIIEADGDVRFTMNGVTALTTPVGTDR